MNARPQPSEPAAPGPVSAPYAQYSAHSMTPPPARSPSAPPVNPRPSSRPPSNMVPPSRPADGEVDELMRTIPRGSSSPGHKLSTEEQQQMRALPRAASSPATPTASASGLAAAASPHQSTTLGVAPPPKQAPPAQFIAEAARAPKKSSKMWLVIGALLFIGAGVALAFVLVG